MQEIYAQADRLVDAAALRGWNGREYSEQSLKRIDRIDGILKRYTENASKQFSRSGWVTNEQFATPVSRRTYMGLAAG